MGRKLVFLSEVISVLRCFLPFWGQQRPLLLSTVKAIGRVIGVLRDGYCVEGLYTIDWPANLGQNPSLICEISPGE